MQLPHWAWLAWSRHAPIAASVLLLFSGIPPVLAADTILRGQVIDQRGDPLPRAHVRIIDATGAAVADVLADEAGRFILPTPSSSCRVEASLVGFQTLTQPCGSPRGGDVLRLVLAVAPLRETVVVTATRTEALAGHVGSSLTAFTADDIARRNAPLVADLLRTSPGAMVVRSGAYGNVTSLFVRGGESSHNKVLLDGIPLNEPGGTFNFNYLATDQLERVEIVRGAHSALFGSDAMSSVVQLFTKKAAPTTRAPRTSLAVEGGSYGTLRGSLGVSGANGRFDYALGAGRFSTDNRVENNAFANSSLSVNVGYTLSPTATLRAVGRGEFGRVGTPGATAFGRADLDARFSRDDGVGGVTVDYQPNPHIRQRASYALSVSRQQSMNLVEDAPFTPRFDTRVAPFEFWDFLYDSRTALDRHRATYQTDWRIAANTTQGDHLLTALVDWDGERAEIHDRLAAEKTPARRDNFGWSVQHQASWPRLFLTIGGRLEHNDSFGTSAVPRGSIVVVLKASDGRLGQTRVRASAGRGIKEPTLLQSFSQSPFYLGNPDLQPERSRTVDVGFEQRLADDRARVDVALFDNRFENLIATRVTDSTLFQAQYFNIGRTRARGAELAVDLAPWPVLRGRIGYTFLDSAIVESTSPDSAVFRPGASLFRRPTHSSYAGVTIAWRRLDVEVSGVRIGEFVDSDFAALDPPIVKNAGYTTWDTRLSYRITPAFDIVGSIDNLTDEEYMEPLGFPALRRAVRAGLRVEF